MKRLCHTVFILLLLAAWPAGTALAAGTPDDIPDEVLKALTSRFPSAQIEKWTRETEDDVVLYDIEFRQDGRKLEADIREDGSLSNWEEAITRDDLPKAVLASAERRFPTGSITEIMRITTVRGETEELEGYEIVVDTGDGEQAELTVAQNGDILEDSTQTK